MKTINKILLTLGAAGLITLANVPVSTRTFEGKAVSVTPMKDLGYNYIKFDVNGKEKQIEDSYSPKIGSNYEVTVKDKLLFPDTYSYKKIN